MTADTTDPSYWLNWRFLACAIYILGCVMLASFLIWKYEGGKKSGVERGESCQAPVGVLYKDEFWTTCLRDIHPIWLLLYRIIAFVVLLALITGNTVADGFDIFYYYTQWTFLLTTVYFGLATAFSLFGFSRNRACCFRTTSPNIDAELGSCVARKIECSPQTPLLKNFGDSGEVRVDQIAGSVGYLFQILYQVTAGAVVLTDVVYWFLIYPLKSTYTEIAFFDATMHSVNFLILGDAILNCMRFPMFRLAYFMLYTSAFVICQWIIHTCVNLEWPYPFMDLSPPYSPIWFWLFA